MLESAIIKYSVGFAICFYVIKELFKLIYILVKTKKNGSEATIKENEAAIKENSREKITETNIIVKGFKEAFWDAKNKNDDMHEIITAKNSGTPLIYNKGLERSIENLSNNIFNQTKAIETLANNIRDSQ